MPFKNPFSKPPGSGDSELLKHLRADAAEALDPGRDGGGSSLLPERHASLVDNQLLEEGILGGDHDLTPDPDEFMGSGDDGQSI